MLAGDADQRRVWQLIAYINTEPMALALEAASPQPQKMDADDYRVLLRANSNYFVLHALYSISAARKLPHARCATKLLQSDAALTLSSEYKLTAPLPFF